MAFEMRSVNVRFTSRPGSELFFGKAVDTKKDPKWTHEQYDEMTWREKVSRDGEGNVYWPHFAIKNALEESGKFLSVKIPGEGKKTFTDRFRKGVLVVTPMYLKLPTGEQVRVDHVKSKKLFVPSDGKRGSGKRVMRIFPYLERWQGDATIFIADPKISNEVLLEHLECVGQFIGFGSMRIGNGGVNGMSTVELLS